MERARHLCDVAYVYYDSSDFSQEHPTHAATYPGTKLTGVRDFLNDQPHLLEVYDYFWLLEDDLFLPYETIVSALNFIERIKPVLCAPSLTPYSFFAHPIMIQNDALFVRGTDFVECMAPLMSRSFLKATLDQFAEYPVFGIERYWQHLLWEQREVAYILDTAPIAHTRPMGGGSLYRLADKLQIDPTNDDREASYKYGRPFNRYINTIFGVEKTPLARFIVGRELRGAMRRGTARFLEMDAGNEDYIRQVLANTTFANTFFSCFASFESVRRFLHLPVLTEQEADIVAREWNFGSKRNGFYAGGIKLHPNGRLVGYSNENEYAWKLDGDLIFLSKRGEVTTRFTSRSVEDGRVLFEGPYTYESDVIHYLNEMSATV